MKIIELGMHYIRRLACKDDTPLQQYLLTCKPHHAKKHLNEICCIFTTMNMYLPKEQHVKISLQIPKK